ncbi:fibronectin type III domain-containing protein [Catelliglobosispora koreensis]|uniref:fibronectin type III domain-containing protein n=1 Tax=Catelliglobosispora koreensis TaxID=129052 RepID=UPI000360FCA0|nr:fibronectin type III domain-containing protein [Catelliglobosispora koreensis]
MKHSRKFAAFCVLLLSTVLAQAIAQQPALATTGIKGIQAGDVIYFADDGTCHRTASAQKLIDDTALQAQTAWLRLDLRKMISSHGCAREAYKSFLAAIGTNFKIIGLLGANFTTSSAPDTFAADAAAIACHQDFDRIDVWEVWNEPNLSGTPGATPLLAADFARYIGHTARAIRTAPNSCGGGQDLIISGGLANGAEGTPQYPVTYLTDTNTAFQNGAGDPNVAGGYSNLDAAVDGIGIHPYVDAILPNVETEGSDRSIHPRLADFVWKFTSGFGIPVYITEFGWRRPADGEALGGPVVSKEDQCYNLIKGYAALNDEFATVAAATWFTLQDFDDQFRRFGLYAGDDAQDARQGYLLGTCPGAPGAGVYNQYAETLEWQDVAALSAVSYEVVLAPSNSPTFTMTKATSMAKLPLMTSFVPPLPIGTYVWRVIKIVDGKRYASKEQWKFTFAGIPPGPTAPSMTAAPDGTSLTLSWTDTSLTEDGFAVSDGTETRTATRDATSLVWTGLTPGSSRCLKVQSYNYYGGSPFTAPVCVTTPTYPAAPTAVTATILSGTSVRVGWTDNANNELRYEINDGTVTRISDPNTTSFTWDGLANGANKCFKVRAYNAVGYSPWGSAPCVITPTIPVVPGVPVVTVVNGSALKVTWADKSNNENGFQVTDSVEIKQTTANITNLTWGNMAFGQTKCFKVRSFNLAGYSAWTTQKCGTTPTIPIAPANPIATVVSGTQIKLSWTDKSTNETAFEVTNGSEIRPAGGANAVGYVWTGLPNGAYLCLRVRAKNLAGESAWSAYSCATTPTIPAAPTIVSAVPVSSSQIRITWTDRSNNETMFQVYNQVSFQNTQPNVTSHTWNGIAPNTTMCFNVRSYNLAGSSAPTGYVCATTYGPPLAPSNPAASRVTSSTLRFAWTDRSSNETGFQVLDVMTGAITTYNIVNKTDHYVYGLAQGTYKCFQARSFNSWGYSAWTAQSCAATY